MILVTGANGHLGKAAIDFLLKKVPASNIAALVRDESKAADLKAKGVDVRVGNYHDYPSLVKAFTGIDKLLLVSTSDFDDRSKQQLNAVDAAKEAGVKHVVYTGAALKEVSDSAIRGFLQPHFDTVQHLRESGLNYTALNNGLYADVLPTFIGENPVETGVSLPAGEGRVAFAARKDMAEAAVNVLLNSGHENKEYNLCGDSSYSFREVAVMLSEFSGKTVNYTSPTADVFEGELKKAGVPEQYIGVTLGFAAAMKGGEFDLPTRDLEQLLGRKPTTLKAFVKETYFPQA